MVHHRGMAVLGIRDMRDRHVGWSLTESLVKLNGHLIGVTGAWRVILSYSFITKICICECNSRVSRVTLSVRILDKETITVRWYVYQYAHALSC